ncbi:AAA family ATPase [Porcipelethomonas sp.]|uniref:cytidylate kinase-like family protein n=1 Tax=Porcipelethomonas sp. TaxID=2981675 RepID=UPI003EF93B41
MRKIICIGRQFGSGGHFIAHKFADCLDIPYYDKKIFDETVKSGILSKDILEKAEEKAANAFFHTVYYEGGEKEYYGMNANDILFEIQKKLILNYAEESDCVIVGRCADYILKNNTDYMVKSIFMTAPMKDRIRMTMEVDSLSEKAAAAKIRKSDKLRSSYYNYYTSCDWGKLSDYDFCINTASNDEGQIVDVLCKIYECME